MGNYKVFIKPSAAKELESLPKKVRVRVARKIAELSHDPRPFGSEKLTGEEKYRVRQSSYRVVYSIQDSQQTVLVVKIAHRREVYR